MHKLFRGGLAVMFCVIVDILIAISVQAATYYAGQSATGDGTGTSVSNLCGGVTDADCTPSAGDTVYLCGAFTSTQVVQAVDGASGSPITYDGSCPGGTAMSMDYDGATDRGLYINGRSWVAAENMVLSGNTTCAASPCALLATLSSTDLTISNITASGNKYDCIHIRSSTRVTMTDITAHDCGTVGISSSGIHVTNTGSDVTIDGFITYNNVWAGVFAEGFSTSSSLQRVTIKNGVTYDNGSGVYCKIMDTCLVEYVESYGNDNAAGSGEWYGIGIQQSPNTTLRYNTIYSNGLHGIEFWGDGSIDSENCAAYSNIIHDNGVAGAQRSAFRITSGYATHCMIYGNVIYNHERGVQLAVDTAGTSLFANNTLYNNVIDVEFFDAEIIGGINPVTGWTLSNNIFSATNYWFYEAIEGTSAVTWLNNNFAGDSVGLLNGTIYVPATIATLDTAATTAAPAFLNVVDGDFRLSASSAMRRAGISGYLCADARGRACYADHPDIGAYQSSSGDPAGPRAARQ